MARTRRIKRDGDAHYHLMSRTNDRRFLFSKGRVKGEIVSLLRKAAAFSGVRLEAWCVPLPADVDGPMSFKARKAKRSAPAFAASDRIAVDFCEKAPKIAGTDWRDKKPCVRVTFPHAQTVDGCRVYDYKIVATSEGRELFSRRFVDFGFAVPEKEANRTNVYLVDPADFPKGKEVVLSVAPCDCFGTTGKLIVSDPFVCPKT